MAKLKEGSTIGKPTGDELIATENDLLSQLALYVDSSNYSKVKKTFTPTLIGTTTGGSHSYSVRTGDYITFGDIVFFNINIALSTKGSNMSGHVRISGLPFKNKGVNHSIAIARVKGINTQNYEHIIPTIDSNADYITFYMSSPNSGWYTLVETGWITSEFNILISGAYFK